MSKQTLISIPVIKQGVSFVREFAYSMTSYYRGINFFAQATTKPSSMLISSYTWLRLRSSFRLLYKPDCCFFHRGSKVNNCTKMYKVIEKGSLYTESYRMYFENENGPISPLHDIPLQPNGSTDTYNMIVEIPRWTNAKMEINMSETLNPIKQDVKKGKVRFINNCFPHHGYIWNYGALPQTWENPAHVDENTQAKGDNDPIDVLEIGQRVAKRGQVLQVKILGCIALIDEGETDWKIFAISTDDPAASQVNGEVFEGIEDIEKVFPGLLKASVEWFKIYKIPDGKPENNFAFNGEAKSKEFATKIVNQVHGFWKSLVHNQIQNNKISCSNVTVDKSPFKISETDAANAVEKVEEAGPPAEVDAAAIDKWHFIKLK